MATEVDVSPYLRDNNIPIIKPDHVSLGQCVVHQQFCRKYSSIKDHELINLLHEGFLYNGFKDLLIESSEQEGFANMHHILQLTSMDGVVSKSLCVQRANNIDVEMELMNTESQVLADINSVVVIPPLKDGFLYLYFFTNEQHSCHKLEKPTSFKAQLISDVLTLEFSSHVLVVNFRTDIPSTKEIELPDDDVSVLTTSLELIATYKVSDHLPQIHLNWLHHEDRRKTILVSSDLLSELVESKIITISLPPPSTTNPTNLTAANTSGVTNDSATLSGINSGTINSDKSNEYWICANDEHISIYAIDSDNSLHANTTINTSEIFPGVDYLTLMDICYCSTTMQCFLLYLKEIGDEVSSFIVVLDAVRSACTSVLEMEMTLNRTPELGMYPLRDGSRLFVQEIFENRTIFYQSFTLLPVNRMLQDLNI